MSIVSEIERIKTNIAHAYTVCEEKGAAMPSALNSNNLGNCIASITGTSEIYATYEQLEELNAISNADISSGELLIEIPDNMDIDLNLNDNGELLVAENYGNIEYNINSNNELEVAY